MIAERPRQRSDISVRDVAEETIVLDRAANQVHQLNATAAFVWHRCDGRHTSDRIAEELATAFEVALPEAHAAVLQALSRFDELGLLDRARA